MGPAAHAGRLQRRVRGRGRGRAGLARRWAPTAAARSASPPPLRAVRPQAAARPRADRAGLPSPGTGCRSGARSPAASPTARASTTRSATAASRSPTPRHGSPERCGSPSRASPRRRSRRGPTPSSSERSRARRSSCATLGHDVVDRELDWGTAWLNFVARYLRGIHDEGWRSSTPSGSSRRTRGFMRLGGADPARGAGARPGRRRRPTAERIGSVFDDGYDVVLTPDVHPPPAARARVRGALARSGRVNGISRFVPYHGDLQPHRPAGRRRARGLHAGDGFPLCVQLVGAARRRGRAALARRPARARARLARPPAGGGGMTPRAAASSPRRVAREAGAQLLEAFAGPATGVVAKSTPDRPRVGGRRGGGGPDPHAARRRRARATASSARRAATRPGSSGLRWVVDPLDGTINFLFGLPQWAVSIACEDADGVAGRRGLRPAARRAVGGRARRPGALDGEAVRASERTELATALVATGFGYDAEVRRAQAARVAELLPDVRDIRRFGSAALDLAWCAAGRFDAYFERGVQPLGRRRRRAAVRVRGAGGRDAAPRRRRRATGSSSPRRR